VRDFKTPLSPIDRSFRQKLNREILGLVDVINQMELIYICRKFHPNIKEYTFFYALHKIFSKIDHILCHKASFNQYKKIEITLFIVADHHRLKLDIKTTEHLQTNGN
jgi:exonuclease III